MDDDNVDFSEGVAAAEERYRDLQEVVEALSTFEMNYHPVINENPVWRELVHEVNARWANFWLVED